MKNIHWMAFAAIFAFISVRANADLVVSYPMNEASWSGPAPQVTDASGNGHDGTAVGGANTVSNATFGQVGSFDGSGQYVSVGGSGTMSGARSVVVWIDFPANSNDYGLPILTGGTSGAGDFFGVAGANGAGTSGAGAYDLYIDHWGIPGYISTTAVTPGQWNQVAFTYNGANTVDFYINGQAAGQVYASGGLYNYAIDSYTVAGSTIGGTTTLGSFDGLMHDMQIYNTQLTGAQILALYQMQTVPEPGGAILFGLGIAGLGRPLLRRRGRK